MLMLILFKWSSFRTRVSGELKGYGNRGGGKFLGMEGFKNFKTREFQFISGDQYLTTSFPWTEILV